jgi:hypothetical protein
LTLTIKDQACFGAFVNAKNAAMRETFVSPRDGIGETRRRICSAAVKPTAPQMPVRRKRVL